MYKKNRTNFFSPKNKRQKVGPAFSDFVSQASFHKISPFATQDKFARTEHNNSHSIFSDFLILIPLFVLVIMFSIIAFRLLYLQIIKGGYYQALADENRTRTVIIPAERGIIFDRNGKPLVRNSPAFKKLENEKVVFLDRDEALKQLANDREILADIQRDYLFKEAFAHVLGYTGQISQEELLSQEFQGYALTDFVGKMGIEKQYESQLHGINGAEIYEVDARGQQMRKLGEENQTPGQNITTTLDLDVQLAAVEAMKNVKKGAVVVSDPHDGGIIAYYSKPTFDPNLFTHGARYKPAGDFSSVDQVLRDTINQPVLDRVIAGAYPPGSTYKLVTSIAALQEGKIKPDTKIEDTGILRVGAFSFGSWYYLQHGRKEGILDVIGAIKRSNDIFFYKAAEATGVTKLGQWSNRFYFGKKLGIDIPGEVAGTVPNPDWKEDVVGEQWYLGDTFNMGIGQGYLLATPLQVNMMTIPFANEGTIYRPHVIEGEKTILAKNFMKDEYQELVREGMRQSCETTGVAFPFFDFKVKNDRLKIDNTNYILDASGSARMTRVKVGCKTGTSEVGDEKTLPHAWITVMAPHHDPEVVITVLVENSGEGSAVAGPIARDVLKKYFEIKK